MLKIEKKNRFFLNKKKMVKKKMKMRFTFLLFPGTGTSLRGRTSPQQTSMFPVPGSILLSQVGTNF